MHKYSSNVIEKCLEKEDEVVARIFVDKVCINNLVLGNFLIIYPSFI